MKILQVNVVYKKGSTGKITYDIHTELQKQGIESVVCYGRGAMIDEPNVYKTCGELYSKFNNLLTRFTGLMYGGCSISTHRLISVIKKERPDIVHLQCINGYFVNIYRLIEWLKKNRIKTVLTLHAEFMHTANCGHALDCEKWKTGCGNCPRCKKETKSLLIDGTARSWKRMKAAFEGFEELTIVAVSDWIARRAAQSSIFAGHKIICIHNGIALDNFNYHVEDGERRQLEEKYGLPKDKRIVLHVTPSFQSSIKGGDFFAEVTRNLPEEFEAVVVGCADTGYSHIREVPYVENQKELAALYRQADVFVITSRADNYPTVCIEANSCGTPVVGFDVGGVKETIGVGLGTTVQAFDIEKLREQICYWSNAKASISTEKIEARRAYCDRARMVQDYLCLYEEMNK